MNVSSDPEIHARILADMRDGIVTLDLQGRITTVNPAAGELLGIDSAEALGRTYAELFLTEEAFEPLSELVLEAIYEPTVTHSGEISLALPGGTRTLLVRTTLLRGERESQRGVIVVLSDLSEQRKRRKIKRLFGAYLDPRIVARLLEGADRLDDASRATATIAFLDLQGFTRLAELLTPGDLVLTLNAYLEEMSAPIGASRGVTDKYIGDGIMAFWSPVFAPESEPAVLACRAALAQRGRLPALRERLRRQVGLSSGLADALEIRCGIATGEVVAGSIGPEHARAYTVIGDAVNLAARLEAANKTLGTRILVAEATRERAGDHFAFRPHGRIQVPGRHRPEAVFELTGER